ncbi:THAP-type domain-containing protein [Caenorhabditis elegans]|uniref:THAP-type domain-containing protein n=1 Tax=Caenorhabditis elegans TaxID=6239 RepID=Q17722_CAEEL|nr:THAP-type domain-containing protein [Caenorhabditis elegans]CCD63320.1 THAP-type domain-containing protein [Caenorhabditis elegans]|eukprot:NP_509504.1 Uncharacterized protein CELE_C06E2.2 [Caenorhabditis elegans]
MTTKSSKKEKGGFKPTLPPVILTDTYNCRFVIQEEIDVESQMSDGTKSETLTKLFFHLACADNIIKIGESAYTKENLSIVKKLIKALNKMR